MAVLEPFSGGYQNFMMQDLLTSGTVGAFLVLAVFVVTIIYFFYREAEKVEEEEEVTSYEEAVEPRD